MVSRPPRTDRTTETGLSGGGAALKSSADLSTQDSVDGLRRCEMSRRPHPRGRRPTAAAVLLLTAAVLVLGFAAAAPAADAAIWTASAQARIMPGTPAGGTQTIDISAAGNEYQGAIIGLRGGADPHDAMVTWSPDSDPLLVQNAELDQVMFVRVSRPTTHTGAKAGLYPDPLVPRGFGQRISVPSSSSSLYVLFHVPYGAAAGTYQGTLHLTNGDESADLPVSLRVWSFGWQRLSTHTAFMTNMRDLQTSLQGSGLRWSGKDRQTVVTNFYRMMQQHGITPLMTNVVPTTSSDGSFDATKYLQDIVPYLGADGLDLPDTQLPWNNWFPYPSWRKDTASTALFTYLANLCRFYADNGWQSKVYGYIVDEPSSTSDERRAELYARLLHNASAQAGFRARFLLTDDPRPTNLAAHEAANKFLWDDVDIWAVRYYYFFGRVPVLRQLQAKGKQVWWYPYLNSNVRLMPNFVIEKPLADQRVWGWLMYQWNVDGMLYWGFNRWGDARADKGWRDPYQDPLSFVSVANGLAGNGEAMLVYPGYYPRYGLNDPYAAPVSSLRLEALRDGFEDCEYMKLAAATGDDGAAFVRSVIKAVTWYPYPVAYGHRFLFPKYTTSAAVFEAARERLAERIERYAR